MTENSMIDGEPKKRNGSNSFLQILAENFLRRVYLFSDRYFIKQTISEDQSVIGQEC